MASVESLVRAALREWVADRPWSTPPTVTAEAPEPGDKPALPTLACWFDRVDVTNPSPREIAPGIFDTGQGEAAVTFLFRCASEGQADCFRAEWRDLVWTAAMNASPTGLAPVLPFKIEVAQLSLGCKLYLEASLELAPFEDTQVRSLWLVRAFGRVAFPALAVREPTALMDVSIVIAGTEYQAAAFQAPRILSTDPAEDGEVGRDEAVEFVFDQPMAVETLALEGYTLTLSDDAQSIALIPESGWAPGAQSLTLLTTVRSRRGTPLAAPFTLRFEAAP